MNLGIKNKWALIFGASRGLGRGIVEALAKEKVNVIIVARNQSRLESIAHELCEKYKIKVYPIAENLYTDEGRLRIKKLVNDIIPGIDILINNTSGPPVLRIVEVTNPTWLKYFNELFLTITTMTSYFLPHMIEQRWGRILTIVSSGIIQPIKDLAISNVLRSALSLWSKTLSNEVAKQGVTVNILIPGRIHTERVDEIDTITAQNEKVEKEKIVARSLQNIPMGRYGRVEELSSVATFLVSECASYITGGSIRVDGGLIKSV